MLAGWVAGAVAAGVSGLAGCVLAGVVAKTPGEIAGAFFGAVGVFVALGCAVSVVGVADFVLKTLGFGAVFGQA